jgi:putative transposase
VFDNIFVERLWRNVKHEDGYLKGYATLGELMVGLTEYFAFYNGERPHQSLSDQTPQVVYQTGIGGGVMIADKFGGAGEEPLWSVAEQGFLPSSSKINSHSTNQSQGNTGAAD